MLAANRRVWSRALRGSRRSVISSPVSESVRWHWAQKRFIAGGGQLRGSAQAIVGGILDVRGGGTMADFATHAEFVGDHLFFFPDRQRAGGMAREASQHSRARIEGAKDDPLLIVLSRRDREAVDRPVPCHSVFAIRFAIDSGDERNRLKSRAEGPIARLRRRRWRKRVGMRGVRLRRELGRMARAAGFGAGIAGRTGGERGGSQAERGQGGKAHFPASLPAAQAGEARAH